MSTPTPMDTAIDINVQTEYLDQQSDPDQHRFAFAYHITLRNRGQHSACLRSRHWYIADGNGHVQEVKGAGVVGEQPRLQPDECFEYSSGAVLKTQVGSMRGYYVMETDDGHYFHADIPIFTLAAPNALN